MSSAAPTSYSWLEHLPEIALILNSKAELIAANSRLHELRCTGQNFGFLRPPHPTPAGWQHVHNAEDPAQAWRVRWKEMTLRDQTEGWLILLHPQEEAIGAVEDGSLKRLQLAQSVAGIGTWELDLRTYQLSWDEVCLRIYGLEAGEVLTQEEWAQMVHPDDLPEIWRLNEEAIRTRQPYAQTYRIFNKQGALRYTAVNATYQFEDHEPVRMLGICRDVTEELEQRQILQSALKAAKAGVFQFDLATQKVRWSDELYDMMGVPRERAIDFELFQQVTHPDDHAALQAAIERSIQTGEPYEIIHRNIRLDGKEIVCRGTGVPVYNEQGQPTGLLGVGQEITQLVAQEKELSRLNAELEQQLQWFRYSANSTRLSPYRVNVQTHQIHFLDMSYRDILPMTSDYPPELIKDFWPVYLVEWILAEDREQYLALLQNALIRVESYDVTYRVWNGTALRWVRDVGAPYETENGEIYIFGSLQDVTDLVTLRESVAQQEARFRATIEQAPYGMLFLRPEGQILYANPPVQQWLGEEALQGQRLQHLVHPADAAQLEETFQNVLRSDVVTTECELRMRGSAEEWLPLRLSLSSAHDDTGALTFLIGSLQDLRELKLTQEALMQSAKLASLGEAAASIAHELKSPLAAIRMKAEILGQLTSLPTFKPEHLPQKLGEIVTIVDRSLSVLQQMRDFSRKESSATEADERQEVFTLSELMEGVMLIAGGTLRQAGIQVVQDFPKELPPLIGNRTKLEQVFVNLCNNARDAMEESEQRRLKLQAVQHGDMVQLQVTDTGCGMPPEVLANLFRAFFTTKARGKGTGLGTSIIKRIVEEHGGRITVESEVNVGTTFTLTLPVVPEEPQQRAPALSSATD